MSKNSKDIVFVAAQRTAIGRYKGIYKDLQAPPQKIVLASSYSVATCIRDDRRVQHREAFQSQDAAQDGEQRLRHA
jgi:hypothetical protein